MPFFDRFFPVLGSNFGLGPLGIFQGLYVPFFQVSRSNVPVLTVCRLFAVCLSIGATILSHHCDDFTLVAAFFLFAVGCVNMLLGLIFRESAKSKRSIRAWRSGSDHVLPIQSQMTGTTAVTSQHTGKAPKSTFRQSLFGGRKADPLEFGVQREETGLVDKSGFGFGRQGEKKAGLKGTLDSSSVPLY